MPENVIQIRGVNKFFHDDHVLENIHLDICGGEFLTLLGPSGCGKTTLLRILAGFEEPSSGEVLLNGTSLLGIPPEKRHINMVFQSYALFPHMTIFDNVSFGLQCQHVPRAERIQRVERVLAMVRLEKFAHRKPHQLSGGQQQRVAIARAVVKEPLVLLLDEPLSALDHALRKDMQIELKNLQRELGITFVFVTHHQEEALSLSDRIVVMNDGCIEQIGTPRTIYEKPDNFYVATFIGEANTFETTAIRVDGEQVVVEVEGRQFALTSKCTFQVGDKLRILVRPEDLCAWDEKEVRQKDKARMIPAVVQQVIYKGSTVDLLLRTESGKIVSATEFFDETDEDLDFKRGEKIWIEWRKGWEVILPYDA